MDKVSSSFAGLLDAITPAMQKLSDTFCVSVDYLRENAMYYIMEYGKYCLAKTVVDACAFALFIFLVIYAIVCLVGLGEWKEGQWKKFSIAYGIIILVIEIAIILKVCFPYWLSPEMYSIEHALQLAQGV